MTLEHDGGHAFPTLEYGDHDPQGRPSVIQPGMTLRDYFAALAMQAEMITTFSDATPESASEFAGAAADADRTPEEHLAHNAYNIADAMLVERIKTRAATG